MERVTIAQAKNLFGDNFLGPDELKEFVEKICSGFDFKEVPEIKYDLEQLKKYAKEYIMVLGIPKLEFSDFDITIRNLRERFGFNPEISEPCFYNQDWYLQEKFIDKQLPLDWYFIKKEVIENTRAEQPENILSKSLQFPSAILCTYTFFAYYFHYGIMLWDYDFIWCSDLDHNEDRIYVGKYHDVDGVNKSGFSIHRHLALRKCYGAIDIL